MSLSASLAIRELRHDWQAALCFVAAIIGILAPLLIILALKTGVLSTMVDRLVDNPANREMIAVGAGRHDQAFFTDMAARDDVAFIVPATRSINTVINGVRNQKTRKLERNANLIPSGEGDPIAAGFAVRRGEILLSASLAEKLEAGVGATIELRVDRRIDGQGETGTTDVTVIGVVPAINYERDAVFVSLPDLVAVERFRDSAESTVENWNQLADMPDSFASFRLYANTLGDIAPLERALEARGVASRPRAQNVDVLISFQNGLNLLFLLIAGLALFGFWASMSANLRGAVERQRVSLSLLRLLGVSEKERRLIPLVQAVVLISIGLICTLVLVGPTIIGINLSFTPEGFERIAFLSLTQVFWTVAIGWVTAVTSAIWAMIAIGGIEADEVLRAG